MSESSSNMVGEVLTAFGVAAIVRNPRSAEGANPITGGMSVLSPVDYAVLAYELGAEARREPGVASARKTSTIYVTSKTMPKPETTWQFVRGGVVRSILEVRPFEDRGETLIWALEVER